MEDARRRPVWRPFSDSDYRLLAGVSDCRLTLNAELLDKLKLFLALAATRHPQASPNVARAKALLAELLGGDHAKKEAPLAVLAASVQANLPVPAGGRLPPDVPEALYAALGGVRGTRQDALDGVPDKQDALDLCKRIFGPVCEMADKVDVAQATDADRAGWEQFYAAAGRLFWEHQAVAQSEADVNELVEKLFSRAIRFSLNPARLSSYYLTRGEARLRRMPPDVTAVTKDAEAALDYAPDSWKAFGLLADACLRRSREQPRDGRIVCLTTAINAVGKAIEGCPKADPSAAAYRRSYQLCLSMAYLERANYERDRDQAEKDLSDARACLVNLPPPAPNARDSSAAYTHLALGNAYEDLGYLLYDDPEKNYQRASEAFEQAGLDAAFRSQGEQRTKEQAIAKCSMGRVYFRSVWQTWIPSPDPKTALGKTVKERKSACKQFLEDALNDDPQCLEAYVFLGQASQLPGGLCGHGAMGSGCQEAVGAGPQSRDVHLLLGPVGRGIQAVRRGDRAGRGSRQCPAVARGRV